jgi:hypothetical protein
VLIIVLISLSETKVTYLTAGGIFGVAALAAEGGGEGLFVGLLLFSPFYIGGAFIAASGVFLLVKEKKYAASKWEFKIIKPIPVTDSN